MAELKANKVSQKNYDVLVLGADSVIDLDGELIYQSLDVMNDNQLEHAFRQEYKLLKEADDIFSDFTN